LHFSFSEFCAPLRYKATCLYQLSYNPRTLLFRIESQHILYAYFTKVNTIFSYEHPFVGMGNSIYALEILCKSVRLYPHALTINLNNLSNNEPSK
jgi:hypothetical protein